MSKVFESLTDMMEKTPTVVVCLWACLTVVFGQPATKIADSPLAPEAAPPGSEGKSSPFPELPADNSQLFKLYSSIRGAVKELSRARRFSAHIKLTAAETNANNYLDVLRQSEIKWAKDHSRFPPAKPFSTVKYLINQSDVFKVLRRMPKGAALHLHSSAVGRVDWIIANLASQTDCYICWPQDLADAGNLTFVLGTNQPATNYHRVSEVRAPNPARFDRQLRSMLTLGSEDLSVTNIWAEFEKCRLRMNGFTSCKLVFTNYLFDAMETLRNDGLQYAELRVQIGGLYDENGYTNTEKMIEQYANVRQSVTNRFPDFDFKIIMADYRGNPALTLSNSLELTFQLRTNYGDFVVGYDLDGSEDSVSGAEAIGKALVGTDKLRKKYDTSMDLFFHAGESDWASNDNLFDAVILRSRRIGHAFNLFHYPGLEELIKSRNIALEICPISNQLLGFVSDLRIHPASGYLARGLQCVISSDDPTIFGYEGLSYDFWVAYMAWDLDLADLKKLALNSIEYSAMTVEEKKPVRATWEKRWHEWILCIEALAQKDQAQPQ